MALFEAPPLYFLKHGLSDSILVVRTPWLVELREALEHDH